MITMSPDAVSCGPWIYRFWFDASAKLLDMADNWVKAL